MVATPARSVTQHVFATLTYSREHDLFDAWKRTTKDFNRFITYQRRLHRDGLEYLRTVEAHGDLYPHIHAVIQHKSGIFVSNRRYFEDGLYQKWKSLWACGHSDFQAPRTSTLYPALYIVKYITKASTLKTLWKKFYAVRPASDISVRPADQNTVSTSKRLTALQSTEIDPSTFFCKQFKIKQCTWSRGFKFPVATAGKYVLPPQQTL